MTGRTYFEHNARQVEIDVVDGDPADCVESVTLEADRAHPLRCRCRECRDDYGDWLYHSRLEPKED